MGTKAKCYRGMDQRTDVPSKRDVESRACCKQREKDVTWKGDNSRENGRSAKPWKIKNKIKHQRVIKRKKTLKHRMHELHTSF